ncbi:membrane protein [Mycolicibacterium madagascariense]|uniref:Membrane protein n=1 Tax=Mycolicibacterium madagascariense TaxID=212765 RepID=A0A7I7XF69_9MYCO|nr:DsbA family protein [Mycolicibacterium madagascariense]MCV7013657.1 DsbA family protein [Mycolicibacterium madagascariense]BBZ27827.1 membrane protein [Mycolicibacterium madagascariense]
MATKTKKNASYDLKAADRRRNILIQVGLTAIVVIFAVVLVVYIVSSGKDKTAGAAGQGKAIRAETSNVITKPGTSEPKAVLSMYEDFLCPVCGNFEQTFGPTINKLIDTGAIAADYNMVAILDRPTNQDYSSRAGAAAYCVADADTTPDKQVFRRFHAALYAQQPSETGTTFPTNAQLIETARQAGVVGSVPECVNSGKYLDTVKGLAAASNVNATPTIRINGEDYTPTTPDALIAKIKTITGDVPGLTAAPAAPVPPAQGGAQAPALAPNPTPTS